MKRGTDLSGIRFGKLLVIGLNHGQWECLCDCGKTCFYDRLVLDGHRRRPCRSCGCSSKSQNGLAITPTGYVWRGMIDRCTNPLNKGFKNYGGRGIQICEFLKQSVANLISIIGERPIGLSIDRIENSLNYSCGSCEHCIQNGWKKNIRWATIVQQNRNTRANTFVWICGIRKCVAEWAELAGIKRSIVLYRLKHNWPKQFLFVPVGTHLARLFNLG